MEKDTAAAESRSIFIVTGRVQGVGFRPHVYRVALSCCLRGSVRNTDRGVRIEVQGAASSIERFALRLRADLPPLARISSLEREDVPFDPSLPESFVIEESAPEGGAKGILVSPDMAMCGRCLADMLDPADRRFGYAFTNCTDCGPRYSITRSLPYDRPFTSMACFPLCADCRAEYGNPLDRRFHAQPDACPVCGPELWLDWGRIPPEERGAWGGTPRGNFAVSALLLALGRGRVAAVKGIGGFHLVCDAFSADAVALLRERKNRPRKALAIMAASLEEAERLAFIDGPAREALLSAARPVVVCPRRPGGVPDMLAPDGSTIGIMLPYAPLHHLLFHPEILPGNPPLFRALVMTSGNAGGEPICLGNREALSRLGDIADLFLFHNRDILVRVDDSVMLSDPPRAAGRREAPPRMLRRARGFVPLPLPLKGDVRLPSVFAAGADLKHTFCITRGADAFVSQHGGDLHRAGAAQFFEENLGHLERLLESGPVAVVRDAHPDYVSSRAAEAYADARNIPLYTLQHHAAHIFAVLAENGHVAPALGIALDGAGYGPEAEGRSSVWGGELMLVRPSAGVWRRMGRLRPFLLPGGDAASREPWRSAASLLRHAGHDTLFSGLPWLRNPELAALHPRLMEMWTRRVNCPATSSCGRLFDAVAALCGLCERMTYEGQAALRLEAVQDFSEDRAFSLPLREAKGWDGEAERTLLEPDVWAMFAELAWALRGGLGAGRASRRFHRGLAVGLAAWARAAADESGVETVALGGGVMNNATLARELPEELAALGLKPLLPRAFPAGDGAVSLGQAAWLVWRGQGRNGAAAAPAGSAELKPAPPDSAATPELP